MESLFTKHHDHTPCQHKQQALNVYIVVINSNGENGLGNFDGNYKINTIMFNIYKNLKFIYVIYFKKKNLKSKLYPNDILIIYNFNLIIENKKTIAI